MKPNLIIQRILRIEGDRDVYLHTRTWSYKAVGIYLQAGFEFVKEGSFGGYENDYEKAIPILKEKNKALIINLREIIIGDKKK